MNRRPDRMAEEGQQQQQQQQQPPPPPSPPPPRHPQRRSTDRPDVTALTEVAESLKGVAKTFQDLLSDDGEQQQEGQQGQQQQGQSQQQQQGNGGQQQQAARKSLRQRMREGFYGVKS
jgi:hypothetical protein